MTTSAVVRIGATADHVATAPGRARRAFGPDAHWLLVSGEHGVDAFPITLVLSIRGASVEHGSRRRKSSQGGPSRLPPRRAIQPEFLGNEVNK